MTMAWSLPILRFWRSPYKLANKNQKTAEIFRVLQWKMKRETIFQDKNRESEDS